MGATEGPAFATAKPGSRPIVSPPCSCPECRSGPGIDFAADRRLGDELRRQTILERVRVRDLRAPDIERERVRRWGEITTWAQKELGESGHDRTGEDSD